MDLAKEVAEVLRAVTARIPRGTDFATMLLTVKEAGRRLTEAGPFKHLIANVTRRVLYIMRHEYQETKREQLQAGDGDGATAEKATRQQSAEDTMLSLTPPSRASPNRVSAPATFRNPALDSQLLPAPEERDDTPLNWWKFKNNLLEHLTNNFLEHFDSSLKSIAKQGADHIADQDVLLTYGHSSTVERFLLYAAGDRKGRALDFSVFVCEAAPECSGHIMVSTLRENGVRATLIPDSAAYAVMSRISKVIVGTHLVLADGGLIAPAGTQGVAVAASMHRVPVVVCTPLIKLTPMYPFSSDLSDFGNLQDPGDVLDFDAVAAAAGTQVIHRGPGPDGEPAGGRGADLDLISVPNASVDYVAPDHVALFVTDQAECLGGGKSYAPSYVYRLLQQYYNPDDYTI
eukprot:TRINITY_DN19421_c0_g1_i1.p1 TRINITY_DN19421_c0_g1~~TRINITY_DN19421_c0_g1_i1.p1  ORF type:complete len:465 (+),score=160.33 TRINITY_DN19421_c0_g1_i1:191-1396(+)